MTFLTAVLAMITFLAVALASCIDTSVPYRALGYRWDDSAFPVALDLAGLEPIGTLSEEAVRSAGLSAMESWNDALDRQLFESGGDNRVEVLELGAGEPPAYMDPVLEDDRYASFSIVINSSHSFSTAAEGDPGAFDLETVLAHELGHALGLDHPVGGLSKRLGEYGDLICLVPPNSTKLMCPRLAGQVMRSPGPDDVAGVKDIYGW